MKKRVILIVLDSVGIGALPDAADFGDTGAHTLRNIYNARGSLNLPNLYRLGLSAIENSGLPGYLHPVSGCYGRAAERTKAKDTTSGHWELVGFAMKTPFRTYPNGFPEHIIQAFETKIGRQTLGNCVASGTEIIQRLGDQHVKTEMPIVYTSADSVFQIAAHEAVIPLDQLYRICEIAREMLVGDNLVGRVIARPFIGTSGKYTRTGNRRDYAVPPEKDTILDALIAQNLETVGIGKIEDIFCHRGISVSDHTTNNQDGIEAIIRLTNSGSGDLIFANLVDTDMLYGHRNDVEGYAKALEYFDEQLPRIIEAMKEDDLLFITADHGCDPTIPGTDHSREYIPLVVTGSHVRQGIDLGTLGSFADIGATCYEYLTGKAWREGIGFLKKIVED